MTWRRQSRAMAGRRRTCAKEMQSARGRGPRILIGQRERFAREQGQSREDKVLNNRLGVCWGGPITWRSARPGSSHACLEWRQTSGIVLRRRPRPWTKQKSWSQWDIWIDGDGHRRDNVLGNRPAPTAGECHALTAASCNHSGIGITRVASPRPPIRCKTNCEKCKGSLMRDPVRTQDPPRGNPGTDGTLVPMVPGPHRCTDARSGYCTK